MENYIFFRNGQDQTSNGQVDAAMFPGASVMALQPGDATGTTFDIMLEPRDCDVPFAEGNADHFDLVELTYPATMRFDELCEKVIERINAIGPFTVVADIKGPFGGDANTPAITGIKDVTAVAINSAE